MMISAVILARNEGTSIAKCLDSILWCDEILVIDDNSSDETQSIAKSKGARVIMHSLEDNFSKQRNLALQEAQNEWVLFVDADEIVSSHLKEEIQMVMAQKGINGFFIRREDILWGKRMTDGELGNTQLLRLAKKNSGIWKGKVHETWEVKGQKSYLKNALIHYPHQSLSVFLKDINFYTTIRAGELYEQKIPSSFLAIFLYPGAKFFVNYIVRSGYKDGVRGFVFAIIMSFHSFLVRAKLWQLWENKK